MKIIYIVTDRNNADRPDPIVDTFELRYQAEEFVEENAEYGYEIEEFETAADARGEVLEFEESAIIDELQREVGAAIHSGFWSDAKREEIAHKWITMKGYNPEGTREIIEGAEQELASVNA